jgi:hypothetical protein
MPKHPSPTKVKTHMIYTVWEVGDLLGIHRQTVIRWIKSSKLEADCSQKPWLIKGVNLKVYLQSKRKSRKAKLRLHEIYCLPCRAPKVPAGKMAEYKHKTQTTGVLTGICPDCDRFLHRFIRRDQLPDIQRRCDVTYSKAEPRIVGPANPPVRVTLVEEGLTHGKAQSI